MSKKTSLYRTGWLGQGSMVVAEWNPGKSSSSSPFPGQHKVRISYVTNTKVQPPGVDKPPLRSNSLPRTPGAGAFGGWAGHCRLNFWGWKWRVEKGMLGCLRRKSSPKLPLGLLPPHPSRVPPKPLLQTTQDAASLSPGSGFASQKEMKLPLLPLSRGGHSLKLGAVTMTMNMLALSTKAPRF